MPFPEHYDQLITLRRKAATLSSVQRLLNWDQETYMPKAAGPGRSDQQAAIAELAHKAATDPRLGDLISQCEADQGLLADERTAANIREMRRDYDMATRLPGDLVAELAKVGSQAQEVWKEARAKSNFKMFAPWLDRMMSLTRRKAECYGVPQGGELYDALLDEYEPKARAAEIEAIFTPLRPRLSALIGEISASKKKVSTKVLTSKIPAERQHAFGQFVLETMGFDLTAGRLDVTTHPFCEGLAPGDTRLTTRYRDEKFTDALYGTMHEMGHGLYEQGLPKDKLYGQPLSESISLGIHESQSRMWENFVGRSRAFWVWALPKARKMLGGALAKATVDQLHAAVNTAAPSYIRVEADEATYNLHIMLRFEIERALISGDLPIKDVPGVWNENFQRLLGIKVPDDRHGCLQDVHWSFGLVGYFPTYTLGNLYAAQFWEKINKDIKGLDGLIAKGEFSKLKTWLNRKIHAHGRQYRAGELCQKITGRPLSADPFMRYLEGKLRPIYGI
ncbi:MAG: Thermostable carboxypeptidase 1 [Phycisphaerales bacterium]|nr:Thermostable carboxypeptidase 1 [Phycisphaerales bacterium]